MSLSDWSSLSGLLTFFIALGAASISLPVVARELIAWRIIRGKARIVRLLASLDSSKSRADIRREMKSHSRAITRGSRYVAADELQWLTDGRGDGKTFTFAQRETAQIRQLAELYRVFASKLTVKTFLLGGSQPIFEHVSLVALQVASLLESKANHGVAETNEARRIKVLNQQLDSAYLPPQGGSDAQNPSKIELHQLMVNGMPVSVNLDVSWFKEATPHPEIGPNALEHGREYDGYLPSLRRRKFERDQSTGNYCLHVELGGIFYSQHKEMSRPQGPGQTFENLVGHSLLTLATLPITSDGYLIFAQRGATPYYPHCWGPGAGGNLEIPRGDAPSLDLDAAGVIDPLRAAAREAREEIGVELDPSQVSTLALARISNAEEHGTWLLATSAYTGLTVEGIAGATIKASLVDGRWEVGEYLAAVPVPRTRDDIDELLTWALNSKGVMPHLAALLVSFFGAAERAGGLRTNDTNPGDLGLPPQALQFRFGERLPESV